VTPTGVEVELLHLGVDLIKVPIIELVAINGAHRARAMSATGTMDIKLTRGGITGNLQEHPGCFFGWILLFDHRNVDVLHSERFDCDLLIRFRVGG
jgi:hypothetical protein